MQFFQSKIGGVSKIILLGLSLVLLSTGCEKKEEPKLLKQRVAIKFPITVVDDANRKVKIEHKPKRIVSLSPSNTEILFALGLDDQIVGVTTYCDYPRQAQKKEKIGSFAKPNIEKIIHLNADLILATGNVQESVVKELEKLKLTVFVVNPKNLDGIVNNVLVIGKITDTNEQAQKLTDRIEETRQKIAKKIAKLKKDSKPKVFFELYNEPLTTVGKETFINELITTSGGVNIAAACREQYPQYSLEMLIKENPDVYIAGKGSMSEPGAIEERPGWKDILAVKNRRVYVIDDDLVNRPGPRIIQGLWEIAQAIHPNLFKE